MRNLKYTTLKKVIKLLYLLDASPRKVEKKYYVEQRITTNYIQLVIFYNTISKIISYFLLKCFLTVFTDFLPVWVWVKWPSLKSSSPPSLVHLILGWGWPSQGIEMVWRSPSKASISSKSSQEGLALKKKKRKKYYRLYSIKTTYSENI